MKRRKIRLKCVTNKEYADAIKGASEKVTKKEYERVWGEGTWEIKLRRVRCKICKNLVDRKSAHRHQGKYIGECCWDERLKSTE